MTTSTTSEQIDEPSKWHKIVRLNALHFDILDDHHEPTEHAADDWNRYFLSPTRQPMITKEEMIVAMNQDECNDSDVDEEDTEVENEEKLSQQMNDLSMQQGKRQIPDSPISDQSRKKMKISEVEQADVNELPSYLMTTNSSFECRLKKLLSCQTRLDAIDDLRQIALLKHQLAELDQEKCLFLFYLQAGNGTWKEESSEWKQIDRCVWLDEVKKLTATDAAAIADSCDGTVYERFLKDRLQQIDSKLDQYKQQLNNLKQQQSIQWTSTIEEVIDHIVEHDGMKTLRVKHDRQMGLLECEYERILLERAFLQEKPTDYQLGTAHRLYDLRFEYEKSRRFLMELKQSVFLHRIPPELQARMLETIKSIETVPSLSDNRYKQLIRQKITDFMAARISNAEQVYARCLKQLHQQIESVWKGHHDSNSDQTMPLNLTNLIEKRFTNITNHWRIIYNSRMQRSSDISSILAGFGPCMAIHTTHTLTRKQLDLLNRGPAYVIPCQSLSGHTSSSIHEATKELYAPLKLQLTRLFAKHQVNIALSMNMHTKLFDQFNHTFAKPIPAELCQRVSDEKSIMQSIRRSLQQQQQQKQNPQLILRRTADDRNTFYLGDRKEFEEKAYEFMITTTMFEFQLKIDEKNHGTEWQIDVYKMIESMNYMLRRIHEKKGIDDELLHRLTIDASTVKLPYLYFLPKISLDNEITLMPVISAYEGPTWLIGQFIDRLLRSVTHISMKSTLLVDDIDFGLKFHQFCQTPGCLSSNTLFAAIHVTNYHAMVPHGVMADTLERFLRDTLPGNKLEKLTIIHMKNLVQLFLYNNAFIYNEQMYTFVKGSPTTIPLTETLADIYLFQWQKKILRHLNARQQFFGRHKSDIFFTWNGSNEELHHLLEQIQEYDLNVHQQIGIHSTMQFMNVHLENRSGRLYSCVARQPIYLQQYTLPFVVHHPIEEHSHWLRFALLRAVCFCTSIMDFIEERIYLELTFLANGYSLYFVERRVDHFFAYFNANNIRYCQDQTLYDQFRQQVFAFIEQQRLTVDQMQRFDRDRKLFHLHYLYEYGPHSTFDESFHRLWMQYFKEHRLLSPSRSKILLTTRHQHSLNALLAQPRSCYRALTVNRP